MEQAEKDALLNAVKSQVAEAMETKTSKTENEIAELKASILKLGSDNLTDEFRKELVALSANVKALQEVTPEQKQAKENLASYIKANSEVLKNLKLKGRATNEHFEIKGLQGAPDIAGRDFLGEIESGIEKLPVRKPRLLDLFKSKKVNTEYLHYYEEDVVTRDAKFVVACATSVHNTKKTWKKTSVELAKVRDIVDVCLDMLDDYSFVESELRMLIEESINLKIDSQLLLGTVVNPTDLNSIKNVASTFNPANVLANFSASITMANLGDLVSVMAAQIYIFGQEQKFIADTIVMNYVDVIKYLHAKDVNGNYLYPSFVFGTTDTINGMRIISHPEMPANTLFVFDSTKGEILDRKTVDVRSSFENRDNFEHELVTFAAYRRLQFRVKSMNVNAFMECTDIAAAITAITKP